MAGSTGNSLKIRRTTLRETIASGHQRCPDEGSLFKNSLVNHANMVLRGLIGALDYQLGPLSFMRQKKSSLNCRRCVYIYIYIYTHLYIYIYIHIHVAIIELWNSHGNVVSNITITRPENFTLVTRETPSFLA